MSYFVSNNFIRANLLVSDGLKPSCRQDFCNSHIGLSLLVVIMPNLFGAASADQVDIMTWCQLCVTGDREGCRYDNQPCRQWVTLDKVGIVTILGFRCWRSVLGQFITDNGSAPTRWSFRDEQESGTIYSRVMLKCLSWVHNRTWGACNL